MVNKSQSQEECCKYPSYISFSQHNRTRDQATTIYEQRISDSKEVFAKYSSSFFDRDCPVCGCVEKNDLPLFHDTYGVVECNQCLTQFVSPCPSLEALTYYYNECECNAMLGNLLRSRHKIGNKILSERTEYIINLLKEHFPNQKSIKILEIGCNSGTFLSELKDAAKEHLTDKELSFYGIDIDQNAVERNVDKEIALQAASIESYAFSTSDKFDLVLHFELIEHLQDPYGFMRSVRSVMSEGGLHHFHTPNANGFDNIAIGYNKFRPLAHGIFPPMHLQSFTPMNIPHFALRSGFKLRQIDTPGGFDVDIVTIYLDKEESVFKFIHTIPEKYLAVFQQWLKALRASSHMRVTLAV